MDEIIKKTVRQLRKGQTKSEKLFWQLVRNRKFHGLKFFRQHPIKFKYSGQERFFVADFYCAEKKLVIEIDGSIHEKQKDYDELRTYIINQLGFEVIRFKNDEINLLKIEEKLLAYCDILPSLSKREGPGVSL